MGERIVVYHAGYGCETGCCGHVVERNDEWHFEFAHPGYGESFREFAEELVRDQFGEDHVADLDWENCIVVDD